MMNNYALTLLFDKQKKFNLFYKVLLNKKSFIVIQNKKYLVVFHKHKINSLHVYYLISCVIFGLFIFFFLYAKLNTSIHL